VVEPAKILNGKAWHANQGDFFMAHVISPSGAVQGRTETKGIRDENRKTLACPGPQSLLYLHSTHGSKLKRKDERN